MLQCATLLAVHDRTGDKRNVVGIRRVKLRVVYCRKEGAGHFRCPGCPDLIDVWQSCAGAIAEQSERKLVVLEAEVRVGGQARLGDHLEEGRLRLRRLLSGLGRQIPAAIRWLCLVHIFPIVCALVAEAASDALCKKYQ